MTQYNDALANLDGLSNFTSVGHDLIIQYNDGLNNLDKLSNLTSVEHDGCHPITEEIAIVLQYLPD